MWQQSQNFCGERVLSGYSNGDVSFRLSTSCRGIQREYVKAFHHLLGSGCLVTKSKAKTWTWGGGSPPAPGGQSGNTTDRFGVLHWQGGEGLDMLQFPLRKMSVTDWSTGGVNQSDPLEEHGASLEEINGTNESCEPCRPITVDSHRQISNCCYNSCNRERTEAVQSNGMEWNGSHINANSHILCSCNAQFTKRF